MLKAPGKAAACTIAITEHLEGNNFWNFNIFSSKLKLRLRNLDNGNSEREIKKIASTFFCIKRAYF